VTAITVAGPGPADAADRGRVGGTRGKEGCSVTSTLALIAETIEPDVDRLERIDGLPALRVLHQGAESVVLVLPATGGVAKLLELLDELTALRAQRGVR